MFISINKVIKLLWIVWTICFFGTLIYFGFSIYKYQLFANKVGNEYVLPWPGLMPDNKLYKLKVLRNKIVEKMILSPVRKVEYDLLMADKTIYASKLLLDKGDIALAKETVLKGEHYYSVLVQDYNKALLQGEKIPTKLDLKITLAAKKHQMIFNEAQKKLSAEDKKAFEAANNFSHINYNFIKGLREQNK